MGVLNVTPDSFSDGGRWSEPGAALTHGRALLADGADLVDVGGESTRPGASRPPLAEELRRVLPVVRALCADGACVSVDTMRSEVARAAVAAGARVVNDVSGGLADEAMLETVAAGDASYVAMHWRAHSDRMQGFASYDDPGGVVAEVHDALGRRLEAAVAAGIPRERIVLDPGLGFAKTADHNWELLAGLERIADLGQPLLVGASRKAFLGSLLAADGVPRPVDEREIAHATLVALVALRGVWAVRVHDVRAARDALAVVRRLTSQERRWRGDR
jgi:dihydropteroate synthase